jgi:DNA-binding MarR family transcriptional regulator
MEPWEALRYVGVEAGSLGVDFLVDLATRFYVRGQTQADIARSLDLDPSTVSRQLRSLARID